MTARAALPLLTTAVGSEQEIFALRRSGRVVAQALGLDNQAQVRLATALSELGRDLLGVRGLSASFTLAAGEEPALLVTLVWEDRRREPGEETLEAVGRLLPGAVRRPAVPGRLVVEQPLPGSSPSPAELAVRTLRVLSAQPAANPMEELRAQNRDLIAALEDSRAQREELQRLNEELETTNQGVVALYSELSQELEDTNRGVVALYAELDDKSRRLHEAGDARTRFWANVSHELRSPANSVIGLARLLLDADEDQPAEERRHQLALIGASGSTLLALVDELLDVAKAESGRLEPHWSSVDLRILLGQLRGTMRGLVQHPGVTLVIPDPLRPPELIGDEVMLTRILRNLLSNALKFTEQGEVRLDAATDRAPDGSELVVLTVTDTGVGIPAEEQERIFEEFYQVRGPHQRGRSGTGLGLPYARRVAELLGGGITLVSTPGRGTTVTLRLPAVPPAVRRPPAAAPAKLAVLVTVDDDPAFRIGARPVLGEIAERVVEVPRSADALAAVRRERPDAVLLDIHMPAPDGYQLLAELAADPVLRDIPALILTSARSADLDHERLVHARAVVEKTGLDAARLTRALALRELAAALAGAATGAEPDSPAGAPAAAPGPHREGTAP
ncbi:hybrid sensor histidine kinase/response regulator [Kitasatospora sp. NBC_00240]|uniref:ATP-binding protein n=1 Tax=Kitasatospora sp. NBC_00240 TaxID=2903567 RepID=UPI0022503771|nr:hybrid sensor histidine kinase/response regulator [Kitasatospora sp. NBC_00240]MCX5208932.1 hybrid sensor histidine kinase/response regulator [Kitasatospora sp. NBC_00240]